MADPLQIAPENEGFLSIDDRARGLAELEQALGKPLPEPYRTFMQRYGGGRPYPNIVIAPRDQTGLGPEVILEAFRSTDHVLGHLRQETYGDGTPSGFLIIGDDPGGIEVLLSVEAVAGHPAGAVFLWPQTTVSWGTDGNDETRLDFIAPDFGAFLAMLTDTADRMGFDHWNIPRNVQNAVALRLD